MKSAKVGDRITMKGHKKPATVTKVSVWNDAVMFDVRFDGEPTDRCCNANDVTLLSTTNK